jgi:hypothetical protein
MHGQKDETVCEGLQTFYEMYPKMLRQCAEIAFRACKQNRF